MHVGGVGNQCGSLHDLLLFTIDHGCQLGKIGEHLSHLIAALSTSHVDNAFGIGVLGESLGDDSLATAKRTRHCSSATQGQWEQGINNALTCEEGCVTLHFLIAGSPTAHRPPLEKHDFMCRSIVIQFHYHFVDFVGAATLPGLDRSLHIRWDHDSVAPEQTVLFDVAHNITSTDNIANLDVVLCCVLPVNIAVEIRHIDTTRDENTLGQLLNTCQRTLDSIINTIQDPRSKLECQRKTSLRNRITNGQPRCVFVHLDTCSVTLQPDDLTDKLVITHTDHFIHL